MTAAIATAPDTAAASPTDYEPLETNRHEWINTLCSRLEKVIWGKHAALLLDDVENSLPGFGAITPLPMWRWQIPGISVGRKGKNRSGPLLLPVRASRPTPIAVTRSGATKTYPWTADGMGTTDSGELSVTCTPLSDSMWDEVGDITQREFHTAAYSRKTLTKHLEQLFKDGNSARWEIMLGLEPYVKNAVNKAHTSVCLEISGDAPSTPIFSRDLLDSITDDIMLGSTDSNHANSSPVSRIIDHCLDENAFRKVDPLRYIRVAIKRDAEQQLRSKIGDPRVGPKVRAIQRELGTDDVDEIVRIYRERYPADKLGRNRAVSAMATPHLMRYRLRDPLQDN